MPQPPRLAVVPQREVFVYEFSPQVRRAVLLARIVEERPRGFPNPICEPSRLMCLRCRHLSPHCFAQANRANRHAKKAARRRREPQRADPRSRSAHVDCQMPEARERFMLRARCSLLNYFSFRNAYLDASVRGSTTAPMRKNPSAAPIVRTSCSRDSPGSYQASN